MNVANNDNEQAKLWNGLAGKAWVDAQVLLDAMFKPFEDLLVAAIAAESASHILDIGCGTGSTTLAATRLAGEHGSCTGVDVSEPMIALARERAASTGASARFICADAQHHAFEPGLADMIISRFGVMFFENPVAAFANLHKAMRKRGRLHCIAWRSAADNPFMTTAERAATPLLPNLPTRNPDGPGQFAFADRDKTHHVLAQGGWSDIVIEPIDVACHFPARDLVFYLTRLGPLGLLLRDVEESIRHHIIDTVRQAFAPYIHGDEVRFDAACWVLAGRA